MKPSLLTAFQTSFESADLDDPQSAIGFVDDETTALDEIHELRDETTAALQELEDRSAGELRQIGDGVQEVVSVLHQANAVASMENAKHYTLILNASLEGVGRRLKVEVPRLSVDVTDCITQVSMEGLLDWVKKALNFLGNAIKQGWESFNLGRRRLFKTLTTLNSRATFIQRKLEQRKAELGGGQPTRLPIKRMERLILRDQYAPDIGPQLKRLVTLMQTYSKQVGQAYETIAKEAAGQIGEVIAMAARGDDVDIDVSAVDKLITALDSFRAGQTLFLGNRQFVADISDRSRRTSNTISGVENAIEKLQGIDPLIEIPAQPSAIQMAQRLGSPQSVRGEVVTDLVEVLAALTAEIKASDEATGEIVEKQSDLLYACADALEKAFGHQINSYGPNGQVLHTDHVVTDRALASVVGYYTELAEQVYGFNSGWLAIYEAFIASADAALYLAEESVLKSV